MLGVDFVIPDMSYLRRHPSRTLGVVLTHAHEDHIGALPYLLREIDAPIFGTAFTLGLVRQKLEELEIAAPGRPARDLLRPAAVDRAALGSISSGWATAWSTAWGSPSTPPKAWWCTRAISNSAAPPTAAAPTCKSSPAAASAGYWPCSRIRPTSSGRAPPCRTAGSRRPSRRSWRKARGASSWRCSPPTSAGSRPSWTSPGRRAAR